MANDPKGPNAARAAAAPAAPPVPGWQKALDRVRQPSYSSPNGVTAVQQYVDNFRILLLSSVPYGDVDPEHLRRGIIEYEDASNANHGLVWHFAGEPHRILRSYKIRYSYTPPYYTDLGSSEINASLLIGFEGVLDADPLPNRAGLREIQSGLNPATVTIQLARDIGDISTFIHSHFQKTDTNGKLSNTFLDQQYGIVEFDGPAKDNDSSNPFKYTLSTLINDRDTFARMVYWYFGRKPYRITKAVRIPYGNDQENAVLIGYQGPGPVD